MAQLKLLSDLWYLNVILKSRQHGFTTLIDLLILDTAVFTPNQNLGIIAHGMREAQEIFRTKISYPFSKLPAAITAKLGPVAHSKTELELSNGSRIAVGTSMRSGTYQILHVSEFGKISVRYPERAKEIVAGSFQAVHPGQMIFVESTAEGRNGHFYDLVQQGLNARMAGRRLTPLDWRAHFFAWHHDRRNQLDPADVVVPERLTKYFAELAKDHGIVLTDAQKAWYVKREATLHQQMFAEHPSTPKEAFKAASEGAIYGRQMDLLRERGRVAKVDHIPAEPVNTFWDLGKNDTTAIWFHQFAGGRHRFLRAFEDHMQPPSHYFLELQKLQIEHGWVYGRHYMPHDAETVTLASMENKDGRSIKEQFENLGMRDIVVVPRILDLNVGITLTRNALPLCEFDESGCEEGIKALEGYQYEWDEKQGVFRNHPLHNWASNYADGFRQWAQGWSPVGHGGFKRPGRMRRNHRTV